MMGKRKGSGRCGLGFFWRNNKPQRLTVSAVLAAAIVAVLSLSLTPAFATPIPKVYYFTWYDSKPEHGMQSDRIVIGNLQNYDVPVEVYFANEPTPRYTATIGPRDRKLVPMWPNEMGGPVRIVSPNGDGLIVTQRVFYQDSFNEVAALEQGKIESIYNFTWYDFMPEHGMKGNWILVANVDTEPAVVDIYVGNVLKTHETIAPGDRIFPIYPNLMTGPVKVVCTNGKKIISSQRVHYKNGFSEVNGVTESRLNSHYLFTWYDMKSVGMDGNWVLVSNNNDAPVDVVVNIGGVVHEVHTIAAHSVWTPLYPGRMDGPVMVTCTSCTPENNQKIMVSQRIHYKDSFEEVQGTPPRDLTDQQYFAWYDFLTPGMNGEWVLVANPGSKSTDVNIFLGPSFAPLDSHTVGAGDRYTPIYPGREDGPVRVASLDPTVGILSSERVHYKNSFNELLGTAKDPTENPTLRLFRINPYWANSTDAANRVLSVLFRIDNIGQGTALKSAITNVTATNGVTVESAIPFTLGSGSIAGVDESNNFIYFVVRYKLPSSSVQSFSTKLQAYCENSEGEALTYP